MRTKLKIAGATLTAVFSLASAFAGTYAWFALNNSLTATGMTVKMAVAEGATLTSIKLIKFDYAMDSFGFLDYLHPEVGTANAYVYSEEEGTFGYFEPKVNGNYRYNTETGKYEKLDSNTGDYIWSTVETMNIYDPVEKIVKGGDLINLNCNAIYEVSFSSTAGANYLQLLANKLHDQTHSANPENNEVLLTDYVDFDVFFEGDLNVFEDDTYNDSVSYSVNDQVIYHGKIYKCTSAISAPTGDEKNVFDENEWSLVEIPTYSALSTYSIGDTVFCNGFIYTCNTGVTLAEYFDLDKWTKTNTYSSSTSYSIGDVVIHDGLVYSCTTAINSGESFNSEHWSDSFSNKSYYPSYSSNPTNLSERIYNKISYLSAQKTNHDHFYADTWTANKSYRVGDIVTGLNLLYKCKSNLSDEDNVAFDDSQWDLVSNWTNYSTTSSYAIGDIVLYHDYFYICKTAISAPTSPDENTFDATKWTLVNEYSSDEAYSQDDFTSYDRVVYECLTANSDSSWNSSKWKVGNSYNQIELTNEQEVSFDDENETKVYVNVNYSPSQSDVFIKNLYEQIVAVHDFYFDFKFSTRLGGNS